ncbi:MAG: type II toxin-antitoxin system VapC family toxin [Planctomycetota bacterium]
MIVADTDVLIDALRGREPARTRIATIIGSGRFATTAISAFELLAGARSANERSRVESLLAVATVLPLDEAAAREAGAVARELAAAGSGINEQGINEQGAEGRAFGPADHLIAGICRHASAALLTRNRTRFERVTGLRLASLEG